MKGLSKPRVFIASPYSGERDRNADYLKACIDDSLARGEAPFAPHAIYPAHLDDRKPRERATGIACGMAWLTSACLLAVYVDLGISPGMEAEIAFAEAHGIPVERRSAGAPFKAT